VRIARYVAPVLLLAAVCLGAEDKPVADAGKGPRISIEPASFDFGKALPNRTLTKEFVVKNFGAEDLVIERVSTTCGCTVADGYSRVVKPGETTTLRVRLETRNYSGRVERVVAVKTNDPETRVSEVRVAATVQAEETTSK
jgi:hypothetical protein